MEGFRFRLTALVFFLAIISCAIVGHADLKETQVVAKVGPLSITVGELRKFAQKRPDLITYISLPNGGKKIAETWAQERAVTMYALKKEGKNPFEAIKELSEKDIVKLFVATLSKEVPLDPPTTDAEALLAYEQRPGDYAVPARAHIKQMTFAFDNASGTEKEAKVKGVLDQTKIELDRGADFDIEFQKANKKVPELTMHDFGFIVLDGSYKGEEAVKGLKAKKASLFRTDRALFLFYVVERHEGFLEPFEKLKEMIKKEVWNKKMGAKRNDFIQRLAKEYGAEILI